MDFLRWNSSFLAGPIREINDAPTLFGIAFWSLWGFEKMEYWSSRPKAGSELGHQSLDWLYKLELFIFQISEVLFVFSLGQYFSSRRRFFGEKLVTSQLLKLFGPTHFVSIPL